MTESLGWPDLLAVVVIAIGAVKGFLRGFVSELTGLIALAAAIAAAFFYPGMWDDAVAGWTHLGPGSAHVVAMAAFALLTYTVVIALGGALATIAKLPVLNAINGALGAGVGVVKSLILLWLLIFVALYFPLSKDLRADLGRSYIVSWLEKPNGDIDTMLKHSLPWFARPFSNGVFGRHRV
jgi:membrane protein required for colicin V production